MLSRREFAASAAAAAMLPATARSQERDTIRIGVLTDMSGAYRDTGGPNTVVMAKQAVQDFAAGNRNIAVEILSADHQQRPDVGVNVARQWFDRDGVDMICEVNNSAIALAINGVVREKNKVHINTGAGTADLTGTACSPNVVHWSTDSWCQSHATCGALLRDGGKRWFFITADYAFGQTVTREGSQVIQQGGGQVVGVAAYPFPQTTDFSSFLVSAAAARPDVIAFSNAAGDLVNCVKQAHEFGAARRGVRLAAMTGYITDVHALGLEMAQGLLVNESFYWDLNDRTRALTDRVRAKVPQNWPNSEHAQCYSGVFHYLRAVAALGVARAKASGLETVEAMKRLPTDDDALGRGSIRQDGRKIHPVYVFQAKAPDESHGGWDLYKLLHTIPADEAFRPIGEGHCPFIRT